MRLLPVLVFVCSAVVFGQAHQAEDCSADGVVTNAVTGAPVPHARVTQQEPGSVGAITGADGKWALAGVACGSHQFTAFHPGFITGVYSGRGLLSNPGSEEAVFIEAGSPAHDLQFQLLPESSVEGSVLDEFGSGLNAQVDLLLSVVNGGRRLLQGFTSGQTDSLGHYRIGGLRPGRYLACVRTLLPTYPVGGGRPLAYDERCYPAASVSAGASPVTLAAGAALQVDFNLMPVPAFEIRGEIHGLPPSLLHPSLFLWRNGDDERPLAVSGDTQEGKFGFSGIKPGPYRLHGAVRIDGQPFFGSRAINANDFDSDGLVLQFAPGVSVNGVVRLEASPNSTAPALSFAAINVWLVPHDRTTSGPSQPAWDASRGSFTFSGVESAIYSLRVAPPAAWYVKSIRLANEDLRGKEFAISGATGPIEITLSDDGGRIEGSLADPDGNPVDGTIFLFGPEPASPATSHASDSGKFAFRDLAPGEYHVYAFDEADQVEYADPEWLQKNGGQGDTVAILPGRTTQVSLTRRTVPQ